MKSIQRIFVPGSEWLYLKIYAGENTLERILVRQLPIILRKLNKANLINKWFFIRYADPDTHLRIRFLTEGKASYGTVINVLYLVLVFSKSFLANSTMSIFKDFFFIILNFFSYSTRLAFRFRVLFSHSFLVSAPSWKLLSLLYRYFSLHFWRLPVNLFTKEFPVFFLLFYAYFVI